MVLEEIIRGRRTIHDFKSDPIANDLIKEALRLSLVAPNHKLTFPWQYFWPKGQTRAQLADLAVKLKQETPGDPVSPTMLERTRKIC